MLLACFEPVVIAAAFGPETPEAAASSQVPRDIEPVIVECHRVMSHEWWRACIDSHVVSAFDAAVKNQLIEFDERRLEATARRRHVDR